MLLLFQSTGRKKNTQEHCATGILTVAGCIGGDRYSRLQCNFSHASWQSGGRADVERTKRNRKAVVDCAWGPKGCTLRASSVFFRNLLQRHWRMAGTHKGKVVMHGVHKHKTMYFGRHGRQGRLRLAKPGWVAGILEKTGGTRVDYLGIAGGARSSGSQGFSGIEAWKHRHCGWNWQSLFCGMLRKHGKLEGAGLWFGGEADREYQLRRIRSADSFWDTFLVLCRVSVLGPRDQKLIRAHCLEKHVCRNCLFFLRVRQRPRDQK